MRFTTALVFYVLGCSSSACSAKIAAESPTQCFQLALSAEGEKKLLSALAGLAARSGLTEEKSSPLYVGYIDEEHHYRLMYLPEPESRGTVLAYRDSATSATDLSELLKELSVRKELKFNVCPPKSNGYSPPTLYQ